jgi:hypothetical protein
MRKSHRGRRLRVKSLRDLRVKFTVLVAVMATVRYQASVEHLIRPPVASSRAIR